MTAFSPVFKLVAEHAAQRGNAPAVSGAGTTVSYRELVQRATRWAGALQCRGIGTGALVAIALDRSVESLVAMLSIVRTGAAYVPLDLSAPPERNALLVRDSGASLLISRESGALSRHLAAPALVTVPELDGSVADPSCAHKPAPDDPFYIAYTSGSTGSPRGVTVTHANVAWYVGMMPAAFDRRVSDRFAVTTPLTFATSVRQTFVPLTLGAHTSVATESQSADARQLLEFLRSERISAWEVVPSMLRACVDLLRLMPPSQRSRLLDNSLRQVGCVGEPLAATLVQEWMDLGGRGHFTNSYGQSEASGLAVWRVDAATIAAGGVVPAGRPTPGNVIHIVGADSRPVPAGEAGEIVAEGPAVALGYRGGEQGERRFVQATPPSCRRSFLTGDIGRFRPDGALEVLGRKDDQLKVRGVRVDPLEVEAALRAHASVREAAVAVHQRKGEGVLVAYLNCASEPPTSAEFRRLLRARLAGPMVPSVFVRVAELPRTTSGKLDRRALPSPFDSGAQATHSLAETAASAADALTQSIVEVWQQVLGLASVGLHDDFFEIGGSSLTGAQVVERLEHDFGIRLSLTTLLKHSTVAELARALQSDDAKHRGFKLVRLRSGDAAPAILCVPGVKGRPAGVFALNERVSDARTVFAMDAEHASLDDLSVIQVATHYASVALATHPGPYCVVGYSFGGIFALETARALQAAGARVTLLVLLDATVPRTAAVSGATRTLVAVEEYLSLVALRVQRSLRDPFLYIRKLLNPAPWQEFRRSMRIASGDYVATPLNVPTLFIRARSLPFVTGRTRVWRALTGPFTTHSIWADHNGLLREPAVARVAAIIERELNADPGLVSRDSQVGTRKSGLVSRDS